MSTPPLPHEQERLQQMMMGIFVGLAARTAFNISLSSILAERENSVAPLSYLAEKTGSNKYALYRFFRYLAAIDLLEEVDTEDTNWENSSWKSTSLLKIFADQFASAPFAHLVNHSLLPWMNIESTLRTGHESFSSTHDGVPIWDYFLQNPKEHTIFNNCMTVFSQAMFPFILQAYDWSSLNTIVDVGGGVGHLLCHVLSHNPSLKGILFDLPAVVAEAKPFIESKGLQDRVEIVGGSFFESVPSGDAIVMKWILHDWSDDKCVEILKSCHKALKPNNGKLLIFDLVLSEKKVSGRGAFLDMQMMLMVNGKERTKSQWQQLLKKGGFVLKNVVVSSEYNLVEAWVDPELTA